MKAEARNYKGEYLSDMRRERRKRETLTSKRDYRLAHGPTMFALALQRQEIADLKRALAGQSYAEQVEF